MSDPFPHQSGSKSRSGGNKYCSHDAIDVTETRFDADRALRDVELPTTETGFCLACGERLKREEHGPWKPAKRKRSKARM